MVKDAAALMQVGHDQGKGTGIWPRQEPARPGSIGTLPSPTATKCQVAAAKPKAAAEQGQSGTEEGWIVAGKVEAVAEVAMIAGEKTSIAKEMAKAAADVANIVVDAAEIAANVVTTAVELARTAAKHVITAADQSCGRAPSGSISWGWQRKRTSRGCANSPAVSCRPFPPRGKHHPRFPHAFRPTRPR